MIAVNPRGNKVPTLKAVGAEVKVLIGVIHGTGHDVCASVTTIEEVVAGFAMGVDSLDISSGNARNILTVTRSLHYKPIWPPTTGPRL